MRILTMISLSLLAGSSLRAQTRPSATLEGFRSDRELTAYLRDLMRERQRLYPAYAAPQPCVGAKATARRDRERRPGQARLPDGYAQLRGEVRDVAGKPIEGTQVRVTGTALGALTGADGRYFLPAMPSGKYTIVARRIGYQPLSFQVEAKKGRRTRVDFRLCPATATLTTLSVEAERAPLTESITNTQEQGVDEGGIVKLHGRHLVVLRRGRLFTIRIGDDQLQPVSALDAFAPDIEPGGTWYDEMLVHGDKVIVVAYSYERRATELGVFRIDGAGGLRYLSTWQLRSWDYYSSRNYATRVVDGKLVFYTPLPLWNSADPLAALPAMRRWRPRADDTSFERIVTPRRVYRASRDLRGDHHVMLHTIATCDLEKDDLDCDASVVVGPPSRVFYVSPRAVYLWASEWTREKDSLPVTPMLYRMPLDGAAPSAIGAWGTPIDQFSFVEERDDTLNVLVRADADGDAMWKAERSAGAVALLRMPLSRFGNGRDTAPDSWYRNLPMPGAGALQNRFVGEHLLYGLGTGWDAPSNTGSELFVVPVGGGDVTRIALEHGTDRIEAMGRSAVVVGSRGEQLHFAGVSLGARPEVVQRFHVDSAAQGELRSHGFFYKPDGPESGVLGLPMRAGGRPGYEHLFEGSASIIYLRNHHGRFEELGKLRSLDRHADDGCRASCVDWYGNARPVFVGNRVFALLGYELVEGRLADGRIEEKRRIDFTPPSRREGGR